MRAHVLLAGLLLASSLAGCIAPEGSDTSPDVAVTHYPIAFLAREIAGDDLRVHSFVEGAQPHGFEPSFEDIRAFDEARLVVHQGAGFDPWIHDMVVSTEASTPRLLTLADTVELIDHRADEHETEDGGEDHDEDGSADGNASAEDGHEDHGEGVDPHTWLSPANMIQHARAIESAMAEEWPEHEQDFAQRTSALVDELEALDAAYERELADCEIRTLVVSHNAFAYLADRYDLKIEAVHGLSPDSEPSASTIDRISTLVEEHNLTTVFFEEFVEPTVIETIAEETGATTRVLSPVGALTEQQKADGEDYLVRMYANLDEISRALRCGSTTG